MYDLKDHKSNSDFGPTWPEVSETDVRGSKKPHRAFLRDSEQAPPPESFHQEADSSGYEIRSESRAAQRMESAGAAQDSPLDGQAKQRTKRGMIRSAASAAGSQVRAAIHSEVQKDEQDNVGVEAAHKTELAGETVLRQTSRHFRQRGGTAKERQNRTHEKQGYSAKTESRSKLTHERPEQKQSGPARTTKKQIQKQRRKKRTQEAARQSAKAAKKTAVTTEKIASDIGRFVTRHPILTVIIILLLLLVFLIFALVGGAVTIGSGISGAVSGSSYLASDADIDRAELAYTEWETDLQLEIYGIESARPGYDEYRYDIDDIGHNPYELMAFLTVVYEDFSYAEIEGVLRGIFNEQYTLTVNEIIETRTPEESDPPDGGDSDDGDEEAESSEYRVLEIKLTAQSFTNLVFFRMNAEQLERYNILMTTKGSRQYLHSPFGETNWAAYITTYYGYRVNESGNGKDYHKGVDAAMPSGTDILAGQAGTVTFAGDSGDYGLVVVIEDETGLVSKYAHCSALLVSEGQTVETGDVIAKTGSRLHLEILKDGQYLNPLFFAVTNDYETGPAYGGNPGPVMGDGSYAALIAEGERHLGKPYVFGASGPNSFDCSGFVCYVLNHSGVKSVGRTNAQGLYNMCTPISPAQAQPGDLIFFTKTYSTAKPVTHVAFYVGGDMMLHAGKPVQYSSFDTRYWREHFYSFGRLN